MARRRLKPIPTRFPDIVARSHAAAVSGLIREMHSGTLDIFNRILKEEVRRYQQDSARYDGPLETILAALQLAKDRAKTFIFTPQRITKLAELFVGRINQYNKRNIGDQVQRVVGIDPTVQEPWLDSFMRASVTENVGYITKIMEDYYAKVEAAVLQGVKNGQSLRQLTGEIKKAADVSYSKAKFIAVDQTGSILGQMTAKRHQAAGIRKFKWSTSHDERVRPEHRGYDGKVYEYGKHKLPGTDYRCRCVAIPVFDDDDEDVVAAADSPQETESDIIKNARVFQTANEVKEWEKKVAPAYLKSLNALETSAITKYTGSAYSTINKSLRAGNPPDDLVNNISSGLRKFELEEHITVYRGLYSNIFGPVDEMVGLEVTDPGYMSTSLLSSTSFSGTVKMEIKVPAGSRGALVNPISLFQDSEYEFLLDRNSTIKIVEASKDASGVIQILAVVKKNE
ncbi:ADP-ribosyltransferase [Paenibacillus sp. S-38]|uniref:ADP-ribosyltransferase n=1 Tax=Paenibacillus sp. S-38 TaxID=3416710 RepID=UPI003CF48797